MTDFLQLHPASPAPSSRLRFGAVHNGWAADDTGLLALPVLAGVPEDPWWTDLVPVGAAGDWRLFQRGDGWLAGGAVVSAGGSLAAATETLYGALFTVLDGFSLARVWNYVPAINVERDGLENYRAFCVGRARAFEARYGAAAARQMPAASAVGCDGDTLAVFFLATREAPRHFENPEQIPAWSYPPQHGPRPPSFARATTVRDGGETWRFISGTSAIKGHRTLAAGDLAAQAACTFDNLRLVGAQLGLGPALAVPPSVRRHWRVYLRHAHDLVPARELFAAAFPGEEAHATFLRSDICRRDLALEIEATFQGRD